MKIEKGNKVTIRDTHNGIDHPEEKEVKEVSKSEDHLIITVI